MLTVFKLNDVAILSHGLERYRIAGGLEVNEKFSATLSIKIWKGSLKKNFRRGNDLPSLMEPLERGGAWGWGGLMVYSAKSVIRWSFSYTVCSSSTLSVGNTFCYLHMRATKKHCLSKMWLRLLILYHCYFPYLTVFFRNCDAA